LKEEKKEEKGKGKKEREKRFTPEAAKVGLSRGRGPARAELSRLRRVKSQQWKALLSLS
tara:strand:- start:4 stop:180 length:177 start_codon:yes stop_codon:yes gene_type:complete